MNRHQELEAYVFEGKITSEVVIACLDKFAENLKKRTVVVMDKASFHRSKKILNKISEWEQKKSPNILASVLFSATKFNRNSLEIYEI